MVKESYFQGKKVIPWLREQGCFVMKNSATVGVPVGTADVFWCYRKAYGWLEIKKFKTAEKQIGQQRFIDTMQEWGVFAEFVSPENWEETKIRIKKIIQEQNQCGQLN